MQEMREETHIAFRNILDCFTAMDGGIRFVYLQRFIEEFDRRASEEGDVEAENLITIVKQFSRIIDIASGSFE